MTILIVVDLKVREFVLSEDFSVRGFSILRSVVDQLELSDLRREADRIARDAGSACVRHIRSRSEALDRFSRVLPGRIEGLSSLSPVRSILFDKIPDENWPVPWHQDLTVAVRARRETKGYGPWSVKDGVEHVQPPVSVLEGMVTVRVHLDETPASNGALRVIPGSHLPGKIASTDISRYTDREFVTCELAAGDALVMSPLILHSSNRSQRPGRRRVLHFELAQRSVLAPALDWFES